MIENTVNAQFVLRTCDTSDPSVCVSNRVYVNAGNPSVDNRINFTWFNVDMKRILGDLWDQYEYFDLALGFLVTSTATDTLTNADKCNNIYIKGLQWSNCNYNVLTRTNRDEVLIHHTTWKTLNTTVGRVVQPHINNRYSFKKGREQVDINIYIPPNGGLNEYPNMTFIFKIYPLKRFEDSSCILTLPWSLRSTAGNNAGVNCFWNNIDTKTLLGGLYDKFDYFSLELLQVDINSSSAVIATNVNYILVEGLPFINDYDITDKRNRAPVGILQYTYDTGTTNNILHSQGEFYNIFSKHLPSFNFNTLLYSIETGAPTISNGNGWGFPSYIFKIMGVEIDDTKKEYIRKRELSRQIN